MTPSPRTLFGIICAGYLVLASAYALLVPPWEAPDEPAHYLYAMQLATRGRPPLEPAVRQTSVFCRDYPYLSSNYEWFQPALGYLPAALVYRILDAVLPSLLPRVIPRLDPDFCPDRFAHAPLFLHPDRRLLHIWSGHWGLAIMRLCSSFLGLPVLYAAYRCGGLLDPGGRLGLAAAAWVAFLPQFTFVTATVRSDSTANALAALVFLFAASIQVPTAGMRRLALGTGISLGLGLLSKFTFVSIVPVGLLAPLLARPRPVRAWLAGSLWVACPTVAIPGLYYAAFPEARSALAHMLGTTLRLRPDAFHWDYLAGIPSPLFIDLFFARFGWANVAVPRALSLLAFALWGSGTMVTLVSLWRLRRCRQPAAARILAVLSLGIVLTAAGTLRFNLSEIQPQGRLLFPALVPWALVMFAGLWHATTPRSRTLATLASTVFMLGFNGYALLGVVVPAYYG